MRNFFIAIGSIYAVLFLFAEQKANFFLVMLFVLFVPFLILRHIFRNKLYNMSINIVPKQYVLDKNTLSNEHCLIKYTLDEKIIFMDNINVKTRKDIRSFILTKRDVPNICKCWNIVCKIFDSNAYLEMYAALFSRYGYNVQINSTQNKNYKPKKVVTQEVTTTKQTQVKEKETLIQDNTPKQYEKYKNDTNKNITEKAIAGVTDTEHVDLNALVNRKQQSQTNNNVVNHEVFSDKIRSNTSLLDLNSATTEEISQLPGVNIIGAKKAVSYRNQKGKFDNIEEFFNVVGVKDHFKDKISVMTELRDSEVQQNISQDGGRIVDL